MLAAGTRLGSYEVRSPLGAGGMGEVYRAHDLRLDRDVAIKVLPASVGQQADALARFEREARAVAALSHPNILAIHDFGSDNGVAYAVTELLEGETLRERLKAGALPVRKVVDYAAQIARGLAAAHDRGFVHRDLKPENVFILRDGRVKILDFGLARHTLAGTTAATVTGTAVAGTDPGTVLGTVGYMAPEQVRAEPADHRADIFALGTVLYEMISGARAFSRATTAETMAGILRDDPPDISVSCPDLPSALDRIVRHCLEKRPGERFQSAHDVAFALEALSGTASSGGGTVSAPPPRRHISRTLTAIALVAATGVAGYWIAFRTAERAAITFTRLTFRRGVIFDARFDADGRSVVYSASFEGQPTDVFSVRRDSPESRGLGLPSADVVSVSSAGEAAVIRDRGMFAAPGSFVSTYVCEPGTLAQVAVSGGTPRDIAKGVIGADWSPDGTGLAIVRSVGNTNRVEYPMGTAIYETTQFITRVRVSPDGTRVAFAEKERGLGTNWVIRVWDGSRTLRSLPTGSGADRVEFAWAPGGDEIWFTEVIGMTSLDLRALDMNGRMRTVAALPIAFHLYDIARDGTVLGGRSDTRASVFMQTAGSERERNLSWLDMSESDDVTADGETLLITEFGEGGGIGRWSVFVRKTDGTTAVRLGEGQAFGLSPDGSRALSMRRGSPPALVILPVGVGDPQVLANPDQLDYFSGTWLHDGRRVGFAGQQPGHGLRYWIQPLDGVPRAVTSEDVFMLPSEHSVSPDDQFVAARHLDGTIHVHPIAGGTERVVPGLRNVMLSRWTGDGRGLMVVSSDMPARVLKVDVETGRSELLKLLMPADPSGVVNIFGVQIAADDHSFVYTVHRDLVDLYLISGLR